MADSRHLPRRAGAQRERRARSSRGERREVRAAASRGERTRASAREAGRIYQRRRRREAGRSLTSGSAPSDASWARIRPRSHAGRKQSDYTGAMFHPVVESWFRARYTEPTPVQAGAWPLIADGQDVLLTAPTGSGKTLAAFLACLDRLFRRGGGGPAGGPDRDPLRLAAQGALQRRAAQPGRAARRAGRGGGGGGAARARDPHRGAHRRHPRARAAADRAPPAARDGDHARIALHPAHRRVEPALARRRAHRDRGRDPRGGRRQARRAPGALARAARRAGGRARRAAAAYRPLGHRAADPDRGAAPGRRGPAAARDRQRGAAPRHGPGHRGARATSWARCAPTSSGRRSTIAWPSWPARTAPRWSSSTRGAWSSA